MGGRALLGRGAETDADADIECLKALVEELDDQGGVGLHESVAESAVRRRHQVAELLDDDSDLLDNLGALHRLLDGFDDGLAHLAGPVLGDHLRNAEPPLRRDILAEADADADGESLEALVEELHDQANVGLNESVAEGAVRGRHQVAELLDDGADLLDNLRALHRLLDGLDDSLAHGAGPVLSDALREPDLLGDGFLAEAELGADVEGLEALLDPLHDLGNVLLDDGRAHRGVRRGEDLARLGDEGGNFGLDGRALHGLLNGIHDLRAEVANGVLLVALRDADRRNRPDKRARNAGSERETENEHKFVTTVYGRFLTKLKKL